MRPVFGLVRLLFPPYGPGTVPLRGTGIRRPFLKGLAGMIRFFPAAVIAKRRMRLATRTVSGRKSIRLARPAGRTEFLGRTRSARTIGGARTMRRTKVPAFARSPRAIGLARTMRRAESTPRILTGATGRITARPVALRPGSTGWRRAIRSAKIAPGICIAGPIRLAIPGWFSESPRSAAVTPALGFPVAGRRSRPAFLPRRSPAIPCRTCILRAGRLAVRAGRWPIRPPWFLITAGIAVPVRIHRPAEVT